MGFIFRIIGGFILLLAIMGSYLAFWGTKDLRLEVAINNPQPEKARILLQQMADAHGAANWDSLETYSVELEDLFFEPMGTQSNPFPEDTMQFLLTFIPNSFDGRMQFLSGEQTGMVWGMQSWKTYFNSPSKGFKFKKNDNIKFWLPTYQYLIEFPKRIQKADALAYSGEATINGKLCDGILASWHTTAPQIDKDQYVLWIDKTTKRIVKLEFTIREAFNFINGVAHYNDYKNYDGIYLPSSMPVESNIQHDGFIHEMRINNFSKNPISRKELRPNNALKVLGDAK